MKEVFLLQRAEELLKDLHIMNLKYCKAIWDILEAIKAMNEGEEHEHDAAGSDA